MAAKVRVRDLDAVQAKRILAQPQKHLAEGCYGVVPIDAAEYGLARDWIAGFAIALRTPNALHLAAAFTNDLTLLTANKALAQSAKQSRVHHEWLR